MRTVTKTFELSISEGGLTDENISFEVEATAEVTPYTPEQPPSYWSGGEPAEGGSAEIFQIIYTEPAPRGKVGKTHDISWLIDILPSSLIEDWQAILYEQYQEEGDR